MPAEIVICVYKVILRALQGLDGVANCRMSADCNEKEDYWESGSAVRIFGPDRNKLLCVRP
jgi:hypothetical protein